MPASGAGWKFDWGKLYVEAYYFYKLIYENEIQALLKLRIENGEMVVMDNVEVAPHNYGKGGKYELVAENIIAYACRFSLIYGKGDYSGFLIFDSKTALISYYQMKYNAKLIFGTRMYIKPENGKKLVRKYLELNL